MVEPPYFPRRSFVYRTLIDSGARFGEISGAAVALDFGDPEGEAEAAGRMGLADLSPLPRTGFKGRGTVAWLTEEGVRIPKEPNRAVRQDDGALVARLGETDILILGDLDGSGQLVSRLNGAWPAAVAHRRGYPVPRGEGFCWFLVSGERAADMFAKVSGVDLRPRSFPDLHVAQTQVAGLGAVVIRDNRGPVPACHLLADSASAAYLWDCLMDAMGEFDGRAVGLSALRRLAG